VTARRLFRDEQPESPDEALDEASKVLDVGIIVVLRGAGAAQH
jgi:hypothetical protein